MTFVIYDTKNFEREYKGITFSLILTFEEEDMPFEDIGDYTNEEIQGIYQKLDRYDLVYFCAHMQACYDGLHLSDDYLAGCLYESYDRFIEDDYYFSDMCQNVLHDGYDRLTEIKNKLNIDMQDGV